MGWGSHISVTPSDLPVSLRQNKVGKSRLLYSLMSHCRNLYALQRHTLPAESEESASDSQSWLLIRPSCEFYNRRWPSFPPIIWESLGAEPGINKKLKLKLLLCAARVENHRDRPGSSHTELELKPRLVLPLGCFSSSSCPFQGRAIAIEKLGGLQ